MAKIPYDLTHTTLPEWSSRGSLPGFDTSVPETDSDDENGQDHTLQHGPAKHGRLEHDSLHDCLSGDDEHDERIAYQRPSNLNNFDLDQPLGSHGPIAFGDRDDIFTEVGSDAPVVVKMRFVIDPTAIRGVQKVHKLLGVGTFTEVYHCSFEDGHGILSEVALKLFDQYVRPEETELSIMSKLHHPNLVNLHDAIDGLPCGFALELCAGGSLQDFLHGQKHREIAQSCNVQTRLRSMHGISCALQYLHSYNIVHRGVTSRNCLLVVKAEEGVLPAMKLGDFRLACEVSQNCMSRWRGAVRYMAPEMMESEAYDVSVDIFSCGILLHEVLSGDVPYNDTAGVNEARLAMLICAGRRPALDIFSNLRAGAEICNVIRQTWGLPADRPSAFKLTMQIEELT